MALLLWLTLVGCAVVCCDQELESEWVHDRLKDQSESVGSVAGFFWMDAIRGTILVTLQDRMDQAKSLVENYWLALQRVFSTMDRLGQLPSMIFELVNFFHRSKGKL